ncbi:MAG: hypothetical protein Q9186_006130 [Xanthomendoza sp. 1 TL-2023]
MIPLDLFAGNNYPYICKFDFVDGGNGQRLDQPSNSFYIANLASAPPKVWSENRTALVIQSDSANTSTLDSPSNTSADASAPPGSVVATTQPKSGLSTGGIVGIAVGALVGGALMAAVGAIFWLRRRRNRQVSNIAWKDQESLSFTSPSITKGDNEGVQEKDGEEAAQIAEMGNTIFTPELGTERRSS